MMPFPLTITDTPSLNLGQLDPTDYSKNLNQQGPVCQRLSISKWKNFTDIPPNTQKRLFGIYYKADFEVLFYDSFGGNRYFLRLDYQIKTSFLSSVIIWSKEVSARCCWGNVLQDVDRLARFSADRLWDTKIPALQTLSIVDREVVDLGWLKVLDSYSIVW